MPQISEQPFRCPYCDEPVSVLVDDSIPEQSYVEDCQVCCRPIVIDVQIDSGGDVILGARAEND